MTSVEAIETTATVDEQGHLALDTPLTLTQNRRVRVIFSLMKTKKIVWMIRRLKRPWTGYDKVSTKL